MNPETPMPTPLETPPVAEAAPEIMPAKALAEAVKIWQDKALRAAAEATTTAPATRARATERAGCYG